MGAIIITKIDNKIIAVEKANDDKASKLLKEIKKQIQAEKLEEKQEQILVLLRSKKLGCELMAAEYKQRNFLSISQEEKNAAIIIKELLS
jgi:pyruvate/oxaloacetate carboxyltransferase